MSNEEQPVESAEPVQVAEDDEFLRRDWRSTRIDFDIDQIAVHRWAREHDESNLAKHTFVEMPLAEIAEMLDAIYLTTSEHKRRAKAAEALRISLTALLTDTAVIPQVNTPAEAETPAKPRSRFRAWLDRVFAI